MHRRTGLEAGVMALGLLALASGCAPGAGSAAEAVEVIDGPEVRPLLMIGIDGATLARIGPLVAQGRLPNLAGLIQRGAYGALETLEPTVSPAIWTTIATGRQPSSHGILGFQGVPGHTMTTLPSSEMRRGRAFWNILSEHGRSVGVLGWWVTWPAEPVEGYVVSDRTAYSRMEAAVGEDAPRSHEVFPESILDEVRALVRRPGDIRDEEIRRLLPDAPDAMVERLRASEYRHGEIFPEVKFVHQADRSITDIALHLMRSHPTDVTAVAYYGVDAVSHLAWHFMEPEKFPGAEIDAESLAIFGGLIDRYYEFVDGLVGELLAAAPEDTNVLVFSDHGFGPTGRLPWSGGHGKLTRGAPIAPPGVLILAGPSVRAGVRLRRPHVLDIAPMVLQLQGLPLAADMPGGIYRDALQEEFLAAVPVRQVSTYEIGPRQRPQGAPSADPAMDAATIEKLKALGYMD